MVHGFVTFLAEVIAEGRDEVAFTGCLG